MNIALKRKPDAYGLYYWAQFNFNQMLSTMTVDVFRLFQPL